MHAVVRTTGSGAKSTPAASAEDPQVQSAWQRTEASGNVRKRVRAWWACTWMCVCARAHGLPRC